MGDATGATLKFGQKAGSGPLTGE